MRRGAGIAVVLLLGVLALLWWWQSPPAEGGAVRGGATAVEGGEAAAAAAEPATAPELAAGAVPGREPLAEERGRVVLEGVVLDVPLNGRVEDGLPAADVLVTGRSGSFGMSEEDDQGSVRSDEAGRFRIELADPGERPYTMQLFGESSDTMRMAHWRGRLEKEQRGISDLELLRYPFGDLLGTTVDPAGDPIPGVHLRVSGHGEHPPSEAVSDADGRFRMVNVPEARNIAVTREGYVLLYAKEGRPRPTGGWEPMEVVLAGTAELSVRVTDPDGAPLPGSTVRVEVSPVEKHGAPEGRYSGGNRTPLSQAVDDSGRARFPAVWAGQRLRVHVAMSETGETADRALDGRLVFDRDHPGARPIVLEAGRSSAFEARATAGAPPPPPAGRPHPVAGRPGSPDGFRRQTAADENGDFLFEIARTQPIGRVVLTAIQSDSDGDLMLLGYLGLTDDGEARPTAFEILDLGGRVSGDVVVNLQLAESLAISGTAVDADGQPVSGMLRLYPHERPLPFRLLPSGTPNSLSVKKTGEFRLSGLLPGRYDLLFTSRKEHPERWVRDVEAGAEDVRIVVEGERPARVTVEVLPAEGELEQIILLQSRLHPHDEEPLGVPELPRDALYSDAGGWPEAALGLWYGAQGHRDERGSGIFSSGPMRENPRTLKLDAGWYWFGAKGRGSDGNLAFPVGTGLVHVGPGDYRLRFVLRPTVPVEGKVHGNAETVSLLAVALARPGGELLVMDVRQDSMQDVAELGAAGTFSLGNVPVGSFRLRIGTPEELRSGTFRYEEPLVVEREGVPFLEIHLDT